MLWPIHGQPSSTTCNDSCLRGRYIGCREKAKRLFPGPSDGYCPSMLATDRSDDSLRARLLARIHRRYVTSTQEVRIGGRTFSFTRVADPDRVLDEVADEVDRRQRLTGQRQSDEHLHLPYWAELWESAIGIGEFLDEFRVQGSGFRVRDCEAATRPSAQKSAKSGRANKGRYRESSEPLLPAPLKLEPRTLNPPSVLDLGCGMGLAGTVAAALGARVLFADLEPPALLFARLNSLPWRRHVRTRRLNWRTDRLDQQFDLILGADILYERAQWESLETFWRTHLAPGGAVLLAEPGRQTGDLFPDWITSRGWTLAAFEQNVPTRDRPIRLFELRPG